MTLARLFGLAVSGCAMLCPLIGDAAENKWQIRQGAVICPNYFKVRDAEAAAKRNDSQWFAGTGCGVAEQPFELTILQEPPLESVAIWRVQLRLANRDVVTVYTSALSVMGFASDGKGPMTYREVYSRNAELVSSKYYTPKPPDPEAFNNLIKPPDLSLKKSVTIQIESKTITEPNTPAECSDFERSPGRSWTPIKYIRISLDDCSVVIGAGQVSFSPGIPSTCGVDIGSVLNQKCGGR